MHCASIDWMVAKSVQFEARGLVRASLDWSFVRCGGTGSTLLVSRVQYHLLPTAVATHRVRSLESTKKDHLIIREIPMARRFDAALTAAEIVRMGRTVGSQVAVCGDNPPPPVHTTFSE